MTLPLLKHPEVTPLNTTKPPSPYIAPMLARITSALTLFSMILGLQGSALHRHGSAYVAGDVHRVSAQSLDFSYHAGADYHDSLFS